MNRYMTVGLVSLTCIFIGCEQRVKKTAPLHAKYIEQVIAQMNELMLHDVTNPPLASRFFAYACLAGYEVVSENDPAVKSMTGVLNSYPRIVKPVFIKKDAYQLAALLSMMQTAGKLQPSGKQFQQWEQQFLDSCRSFGYSDELIQQAVDYALVVSQQIIAYAKTDGYNKISNYPRYTPVEKEGSWYPTPPAFLPAVEPYFNTVRPFSLNNLTQFQALDPVLFSKKKNTPFFRMMKEVYEESLSKQKDHLLIASFWDCNPFSVEDEGHLIIGLKKISPGAHWMGITGIVCAKAGKSFDETMKINAIVSIGLMDAFICCWEEKYLTNRLRPETAIRKYIDPAWKPFLQTPPFPEYVSGHSVVSSASAQILTHFFGESFVYTDDVETHFGIAARTYKSFKEAAKEAAISRLYGGIHFRDAIENGMLQGEKVGDWVLDKLK